MFPTSYISGDYAVGTELFTITDSERMETLSERSENRNVTVRMYYPVLKDAVQALTRARVYSDSLKAAIKKTYRVKNIDSGLTFADYYEKAPHAPGQSFPLIVFNHGYNSYIEANTYLCIELASHGYMVASIGHHYEAVELETESGEVIAFDKSIMKKMYKNPVKAILSELRILREKVSDEEAYRLFKSFQDKYVPFMKGRLTEWNADTVLAVNEIKKRYSRYLDLSNGIGASGHSFGGNTAYHLCQYNEDFTCGINIDGGIFGDGYLPTYG